MQSWTANRRRCASPRHLQTSCLSCGDRVQYWANSSGLGSSGNMRARGRRGTEPLMLSGKVIIQGLLEEQVCACRCLAEKYRILLANLWPLVFNALCRVVGMETTRFKYS